MEVTLRLPRRASYADYLAAEQGSGHRHEFLDGVIITMAGNSAEHNVLAGRLAGLVESRATGSCRYYTSGQRFWIASRARARYADGSILCGMPEHPAHDDRAHDLGCLEHRGHPG